jgi:hypothetical protein
MMLVIGAMPNRGQSHVPTEHMLCGFATGSSTINPAKDWTASRKSADFIRLG